MKMKRLMVIGMVLSAAFTMMAQVTKPASYGPLPNENQLRWKRWRCMPSSITR